MRKAGGGLVPARRDTPWAMKFIVEGAGLGSRGDELVVRPIEGGEMARFNQGQDTHHWTSTGGRGNALSRDRGRSRGCAAPLSGRRFELRSRDWSFGWTMTIHSRRLRRVVNNRRFCVLPKGMSETPASHVLRRALREISADFQARDEHRVLAVETFTGPSRHRGTCYAVATVLRRGSWIGTAARESAIATMASREAV